MTQEEKSKIEIEVYSKIAKDELSKTFNVFSNGFTALKMLSVYSAEPSFRKTIKKVENGERK